MNRAHVHLLINHAPMFTFLLGLLVLFIGRLRRSAEITMVALVLFVTAAVVTVPTYLSGQGSSRILKGLEGMDREVTKNHSSAAQFALICSLILGAVAVWALLEWRRTGDLAGRTRMIVWVVALFTTAVMMRASYLGGAVRHTEARPDFVVPTAEPQGPGGGPASGAP